MSSNTALIHTAPISIGTSESICICMFPLREHHRSHTLQDAQETPVSLLGWFLTHSVAVLFMGPGKKDGRKGVRTEEGKEGRKREGRREGGKEGSFSSSSPKPPINRLDFKPLSSIGPFQFSSVGQSCRLFMTP